MKKTIWMTVLLLGFFLTGCKKEEPLSTQPTVNSEIRNANYKTGIEFDAQTGQRTFSIVFEIEYGRIQELAFEGEWEFTLPNGSAILKLNERDFFWRQDGRRTIGSSRIDLSNYLAQSGVTHQIKSLRYHLLIDGKWWHYTN